jgi:uncharacterized protein
MSPDKVLVILGPRQVGKTTMARRFIGEDSGRALFVHGDDVRAQSNWGSNDLELLLRMVEGYDLALIDEAQRIPSIGVSLKLLVDAGAGVKLIATGSSAFELAGQVGEPLTGRKRTLTLLPLSQSELGAIWNRFELTEKLDELLVYGSYPEVITAASREEKRAVLQEITGSYLLKDLLELDRIRNSKVLLDLLRLVAFQIGSEVSHRELATRIGLDGKTVARYLDLLEKAYVLYNVRGFSRNLRKEVTKKSKYYFYDTGIRNAVIANFNELPDRDDRGALWENFIFAERLKRLTYDAQAANTYFWRTWDGQEIDMVEERGGRISAYEMKRRRKGRPAAPTAWKEAYPEATYTVITPENYLDFVLADDE